MPLNGDISNGGYGSLRYLVTSKSSHCAYSKITLYELIIERGRNASPNSGECTSEGKVKISDYNTAFLIFMEHKQVAHIFGCFDYLKANIQGIICANNA